MDGLQDAAVERAFQFALDTDGAATLSRVSRQWREAACRPSSWAGKEIVIARGHMTREQLGVWMPRWNLAEVICMRYAQHDMLVETPSAPCEIWHLWDTELPRRNQPMGAWREVEIDGDPWLACITAERAPDRVSVVRGNAHGREPDLHGPVCLGWTTAKSVEELGDMTSRVAGYRRQRSDIILSAALHPLELCRRALVMSAMQRCLRPEQQPICFDEDSRFVAHLLLDRENGLIRACTQCSGDRQISLSDVDYPVNSNTPLRFFIAVQDTGARRCGAPAVTGLLLEPTRATDARART